MNNYIFIIFTTVIIYYSVTQICSFFGIPSDAYSPYINFYVLLAYFSMFLPLNIDDP
jgi:hypothetical protein